MRGIDEAEAALAREDALASVKALEDLDRMTRRTDVLLSLAAFTALALGLLFTIMGAPWLITVGTAAGAGFTWGLVFAGWQRRRDDLKQLHAMLAAADARWEALQ